MIWDQFSKVQTSSFTPFLQLKSNHQQLLLGQNNLSLKSWNLGQMPFINPNKKNVSDESQREDKFQQLLKKIQKVKQDYEEDQSKQSSKLNFSLKEEKLEFRKTLKSKIQTKIDSKPLKRAKTMKDLDLNLGIDKFTDHVLEKTPLKITHDFNNQLLNHQTNLNFSESLPKTSKPTQKVNDLFKNQIYTKSKENHHQILKFGSSQDFSRLNETKKTINFDLNILDKVSVRQSINLDAQNLINLQSQYNTPFLFTQQIKFSDFQVGRSIGSGKFGQVYLCRHKKTNFICALKKIMKSTIEQYRMVDQFIRQLKISYMVNHPNVIKTYGHFHDQFHVFLLMQYAGDGCVIDNLQFKKSQQFSSKVLFQTLNAVDHLHRLKIVHRDIKPENIVVFFTDTYKLCDFGLSAFIDNDMKHTFCGTPDYVSPQMKDIGQYDTSVDLWSLGVLAYELIMGEPPFKDKITQWKKSGWKKTNYWTWKVQYPKQISDKAQTFMKMLLKQRPEQRANIISCLRQQFIRKQSKKQADIIKAAQLSRN